MDKKNIIKALVLGMPNKLILPDVVSIQMSEAKTSKHKKQGEILYLFRTRIAGLYFYDGYKNIGLFKHKDKVTLVVEPDNPYDWNAIEVFHTRTGIKLGYIPKDKNDALSSLIAGGFKVSGFIVEIISQKADTHQFDDEWRDIIIDIILEM